MREHRALGLARSLLLSGLIVGLGATLVIPGSHLVGRAFRTHGRVAALLRPLAERSTVLGADGSVIGRLGVRNRSVVRHFRDVPRVVVDAVVAAEDRTYWTNHGVDLPAMGRALLHNVRSGDVQGGSTIAQQLVKNRVLSRARTTGRKARELVLAYRLKGELGRRRTLLEYLNTVYFGENSYGIATAAERIAGKSLDQLTVGDAALLAGLIRSPVPTDPFDHPDAARARRDEVLDAMVAQHRITRAEADAATAEPLPDAAHRPAPDLRPTSYFVDEVQRRLLADPRLGATAAEREQRLLRGGLQIHTTFDPRVQATADAAVRDTLPPSRFTAAMAVMDPQTGAVLALVGGPSFTDVQYNLASQGRRQPGSTFKIVTLTTALENGYSPDDLVDGTAGCVIPVAGQPPWTPGGLGGGIMTIREATTHSINCAFARIITGLGPAKVAAVAHAMGVTSNVPPYPSITLGTVEASPLEMATVVSTLAADGVRHDPRFVTEVTDARGTPLFQDAPSGTRAVSAQSARTAIDVLKGVLVDGTGTAARLDRPAFGKTGTTDDHADAWFVGATPQLAAAVWLGDPHARTPIEYGNQVVFGGVYPAQIWSRFMQAALAGAPGDDFPPPDPSLWPPPAFASETGRGPMAVAPPPAAGGGGGGRGAPDTKSPGKGKGK